MTVTITTPTIHNNGSHPQDLKDNLRRAHTFIRNAIEAMQAVTPHGRDYQTISHTLQARADHDRRMADLTTIRDELMALWEGIYNQERR